MHCRRCRRRSIRVASRKKKRRTGSRRRGRLSLSGGRRRRSKAATAALGAVGLGAVGLAAYAAFYAKDKKSMPPLPSIPPSSPSFTPSPPSFTLPTEILFLIHLTGSEGILRSPLGVNPEYPGSTRNPVYLTVVTTDTIDLVRRYLTCNKRLLIFSKELLRRKDYVINSRDCGKNGNIGVEYVINVNPVVTYFPSQLPELVIALRVEKALRLTYLANHSVDAQLLMFNEVIFANPIHWDENNPCFKDITIDDKTAVDEGLITSSIQDIFKATSYRSMYLRQHLRLTSILKSYVNVNLGSCVGSQSNEESLPFYFKRQLTVDCGIVGSWACSAITRVLNQYPSDWTELIRRLNDRASNDEKAQIEQEMIESARTYRQNYYDEFSRLEFEDT